MPAVEPPLRADARRNRTRIRNAAASVFEEHGLQVGVEVVARQAGVGMGTLYRHFPTKADLIDSVFEERLQQFGTVAADALAREEPARGFHRFLEGALELQARNRGFNDLIRERLSESPRLAETIAEGIAAAEELLARAQEAGAVRADVSFGDVRAILWTTGHLIEITAPEDPDYWRRFLVLILDALDPRSATPLPGSPPASLPPA